MSAIAAQQAEKCLHVQVQATLYERTMSAIAVQQAEKCLHVQIQARQHHPVRAGHARDSSPANKEALPGAPAFKEPELAMQA